VTPQRLAELIASVTSGQLTATTARQAFLHMLEHDVDTRTAITALGLSRIDSDATLQPFVERAITDLPAAASDVRNGKRKALDALKGHVMRATKGKADPQALESLLLRALLG